MIDSVRAVIHGVLFTKSWKSWRSKLIWQLTMQIVALMYYIQLQLFGKSAYLSDDSLLMHSFYLVAPSLRWGPSFS
jgi:hypothetical protein